MTTASRWLSGGSERVCLVSHGLNTSLSVTLRLQQTRRNHWDRELQNPTVYTHALLTLPPGKCFACIQWRSQKFQLGRGVSSLFRPLFSPFVSPFPALPLLPFPLPLSFSLYLPSLPLEVGRLIFSYGVRGSAVCSPQRGLGRSPSRN